MKIAFLLLSLIISGFCLSDVHTCFQARKHLSNGSPSMQTSDDHSTGRADPLNGLKKYRGGYDIENKHYWASAAFTGIYGYSIGTAVLLIGLVVFIVYQVKRNEKVSLSTTSFRLLFLVPVVFITAVALIFCAMILVGNKKLHSEAHGVETTLLKAADEVTRTIYYVTGQISQVTATLEPFNNEYATSERLFSTRDRLYFEAIKIQNKVEKKKHLINGILKAVNVTIIVFIVLTMIVLLAGLALMDFSIPVKLQRKGQYWRWIFSVITLLLLLLTVFSWFAFGFYYMTYNVVEDTCMALEQFQRDPYRNSLGSILPCVNLKGANETVRRMREDVSTAIIRANRNISKLRTQLNSWDNDRYMPHICNPFSGPPQFKLTRQCESGTVTLDRVPEVLKPFECGQQDCVNGEGKRIPNRVYKTILAYSLAAKTLIDTTPSLESLINCSFVVDAFRVLVDKKCAPVRSATHLIWAAFAGLATTSVILFILYIRELYHYTSG